MDEYLWQYVLMCEPFATKDDVEEIRELNEWDLLIVFKNGKKIIYDRFTNYHKDIYYVSIDEITEEQEKKEFAYRLRSFMGRREITQERLAKMTDLTQAMISRYVRGEAVPSAIILRKIAKALNCSMDDFFDRNY